VLGIGCRPTWNSCVWLLHSRANWRVLFHAAHTAYTMWTLECAISLLVGGALQVTVVTVTWYRDGMSNCFAWYCLHWLWFSRWQNPQTSEPSNKWTLRQQGVRISTHPQNRTSVFYQRPSTCENGISANLHNLTGSHRRQASQARRYDQQPISRSGSSTQLQRSRRRGNY